MDFIDGFVLTGRGEEEEDSFEALKDKILVKMRHISIEWVIEWVPLTLNNIMNNLESSRYRMIEKAGEGTFSEVYKACDQ